jgi:phosphoribosylaminoimidazole-succinocarboxamide synthase
MTPVYETSIRSLPLVGRGKVRDIYAVGQDKLLIVTTDRLSAYDVVLPTPVPEKGRVLTELANFWFARLASIVPNHLTGIDAESVVSQEEREQVRGRSIVVKKMSPLPVEAVVRGYLEGSGWKEYQESGKVCGIALPPGLKRASKLPQPIFTPATKVEAGHHDENITFERMSSMVGEARAKEVRDTAIALYRAAAEYALARGIIIADTKFEFGLFEGKLILIDEVLTPDSSRFWPASEYVPGKGQPSFDKQFVRDYLETLTWDKNPPAPALPPEVVAKTQAKYLEAYEKLTGKKL